jgi:hypothetical protein
VTRPSARDLLFALYVIVCASALTWPVYDLLGNRVEPFVFGLPFTMAWNVAWVLASFVVLALYHSTRPRT